MFRRIKNLPTLISSNMHGVIIPLTKTDLDQMDKDGFEVIKHSYLAWNVAKGYSLYNEPHDTRVRHHLSFVNTFEVIADIKTLKELREALAQSDGIVKTHLQVFYDWWSGDKTFLFSLWETDPHEKISWAKLKQCPRGVLNQRYFEIANSLNGYP